LGKGGMGIVYLARHRDLEHLAAIKLLSVKQFHSDKDVLLAQRFLNEAKILAALNHPNIVRLHNCEMAGDTQPYIVMEYLEGVSLSSLLEKAGILSQRRVLSLFD